MCETNESTSAPSHRQPLFAAAGLFPAASIIKNDDNRLTAQALSEGTTKDNSLESLTLNLAPSTLSAIFAAQKPQTELAETKTPESVSSESGQSVDEDQREQTRKRKHSVSTDEELEKDTSLSRRNKDKHKKRKKKHKHDKKKKKRKSRSSSPQERFQSSVPKIPKGAVFFNDIPDMKPEYAYHIDRKSNKDLWHYESVSQRHLAKYKSLSYNCLGATHIKSRDDSKWGSKHKQTVSRYFTKEGIKQNRMKGVELTPKEKSVSGVLNTDFIHIPEDRVEKKTIGNYSCLDDATAQYIKGKDSGYSTQLENLSDDFVMDEIFEKVRRFNEKTRDEPNNVQQWLEFVHFQDIVAQEDKSFKGQTIHLREVYQPSKSVIEKKLAILDKALEANPSSLELKLAQLELYQDIWESPKVEKEWEDLLFRHSANVDLWRQYLSNQQARLFKFSFNRIVKCYHKCFKTLTPILDGQVTALNKRDNMEEKMIALFAQYCDFLHHCGYTERALSSYQAMIEFNLFCPPALNLSTSRERLQKFEDFWESSVPRFGEKGARGWTKWMENQTSGDTVVSAAVSTEEEEDAIILEKLPRSQTWLKMEKVRQDAHWLPWRPDVTKGETEESCEDLDRVVLFDDIGPAVFRLTKSETCISIVCHFLKFLGLASDTLDRKLAIICEETESLQFLQYSQLSISNNPSISCFKCGVDKDSTWRPHSSLLNFVREVLLQAEAYFSSSNRVLFTLLHIELEVLKTGAHSVSELSKSNGKDVKKFGKNLLKESQNRSNLVIWDAYIRTLWASADKIGETVSMVDTALAMFMGTTSLSDSEKALGLCMLCRTYSQIMLNFEPLEHIHVKGRHSPPGKEDKNQVIACLGALVESKGFKPNNKFEVTPAYILKVRKRFETILSELCDKLDKTSPPSTCDLTIAFVDCFTLFEFCASNFKAAKEIPASWRKHLKALEHTNEQNHTPLRYLQKYLYLSQISFITNVMHISIIPLSEMRLVLDEALQNFPDCPQLHAAFLEFEAGSHLAGRLRKYYESNLKHPASVTVPLFAVMSEMLRHQTVIKSLSEPGFQETAIPDSGMVHRIRSVFEHSLTKKVSSRCPLLWRLYYTFESKYGSTSRAKGIFYRALQSCPWAKCLYMDGISIFGDGELQEMMDLMTEEELRVRMPLEEVDLLMNAEKEDSDEEKVDVPTEEQDLEEKYHVGENVRDEENAGDSITCEIKAENDTFDS